MIHINTKTDNLQTLSEDQFNLIEVIKQEYELGMLVLNSLTPHTATIYGGSLIGDQEETYKDIQIIAKILSEKNWSIVSGGGPGIMSAALSGAKQGKGKAVALCINIPGEPPFKNPDVSITFSQFSVRKYLLRQSDIFIFAPGGIGTLDELMEIFTLIKTHKHPPKKIFLFDTNFWHGYIYWLENILIKQRRVVSGEFTSLFYLVNSAEEIMDIIGYEK
ncbi:MAG: LOG family protein [candidate division SR1 bacterium]|nr:LOG family protein [candidate division SR1 bacterium]